MAHFLLLYTGGDMAEGEAEQAKIMEAWNAWFGALGSDLIDGGNPFTPVAKTISSTKEVSDGAVGEMATGYSIIQAESLAAATEKATGCPVLLSGGAITVYETFPVM
jgi:hypothetical protein